jgi:hypothetical protein
MNPCADFMSDVNTAFYMLDEQLISGLMVQMEQQSARQRALASGSIPEGNYFCFNYQEINFSSRYGGRHIRPISRMKPNVSSSGRRYPNPKPEHQRCFPRNEVGSIAISCPKPQKSFKDAVRARLKHSDAHPKYSDAVLFKVVEHIMHYEEMLISILQQMLRIPMKNYSTPPIEQ